jgi:Protein of unknown function (DUF3108)
MIIYVKLAIPELLLVGLCFSLGVQTAISPQQSNVPMSTAGPHIMAPPANYRFPDGQSYTYGVEWHLVNAGTATVRMEAAGDERNVSALADSSGVVNVLYSLHDRFEARFDPHTFCSLRVVKHTEEGTRKRDTQIRFDYTRQKSVLEEKNLKTGEMKHAENDIPPCITDVVTGFYYLQSLPLQIGNLYTFPINDGGKTTDVQARVDARERVKTPAGVFSALRVVAEPIAGPLKSKGKVWVWYSDDENHTPVQMRSKLGWGTLLFRLQRWQKP